MSSSPPPPLPAPPFVHVARTAGEPLIYHSDSSNVNFAGFQASDPLEQFVSLQGQRSSSAAGSVHSLSSSTSKASQRSWEEDDVFDQVLKEISRDLEKSVNILRTQSISRFAMILTKTGRSQAQMQRALKRELQRFQKQAGQYYGISGRSVHTGAISISGEYKECRDK